MNLISLFNTLEELNTFLNAPAFVTRMVIVSIKPLAHSGGYKLTYAETEY